MWWGWWWWCGELGGWGAMGGCGGWNGDCGLERGDLDGGCCCCCDWAPGCCCCCCGCIPKPPMSGLPMACGWARWWAGGWGRWVRCGGGGGGGGARMLDACAGPFPILPLPPPKLCPSWLINCGWWWWWFRPLGPPRRDGMYGFRIDGGPPPPLPPPPLIMPSPNVGFFFRLVSSLSTFFNCVNNSRRFFVSSKERNKNRLT